MKRLILTIIYADGYACISRNYRLQKLGGYEWLENIFKLTEQSLHVDEITIINASQNQENRDPKSDKFKGFVKYIVESTNLPLSIGGQIRDNNDIETLYAIGADRVVIRKKLEDREFIQEITRKYGQQSIMGWVDIVDRDSNIDKSDSIIYTDHAEEYIKKICTYFNGEILLNSIRQDGTGQGPDKQILKLLEVLDSNSQFIISGGMSTYDHVCSAFDHENVNAISTSNLFAQIGGSLPKIRSSLLVNGYPIANHLISLSS